MRRQTSTNAGAAAGYAHNCVARRSRAYVDGAPLYNVRCYLSFLFLEYSIFLAHPLGALCECHVIVRHTPLARRAMGASGCVIQKEKGVQYDSKGSSLHSPGSPLAPLYLSLLFAGCFYLFGASFQGDWPQPHCFYTHPITVAQRGRKKSVL